MKLNKKVMSIHSIFARVRNKLRIHFLILIAITEPSENKKWNKTEQKKREDDKNNDDVVDNDEKEKHRAQDSE